MNYKQFLTRKGVELSMTIALCNRHRMEHPSQPVTMDMMRQAFMSRGSDGPENYAHATRFFTEYLDKRANGKS